MTKVITIHFVIPDKGEDMVNAHTHGLESYGHKEFQVLVPGFCSNDASLVLHDHADRVINQGERFKHGDFGQVDVVMCDYIEVPGDLPGEPTRLRIVHLPGELYPDWPDELSRPPGESSQDIGAGDRERENREGRGRAPSPGCEEARRVRRRASR